MKLIDYNLNDNFSQFEMYLRGRRWIFKGSRNGWRKWMCGNGRAVVWVNDGGQIVSEGKPDEWVLRKMGKWGPINRRRRKIRRSPNVISGMKSLSFLADKYK